MNRHLMRAVVTLAAISTFSPSFVLPRDPMNADRSAVRTAPGQKARPFLRDVELTRLSLDTINEEKFRLQGEMRKRWAQAGAGTLATVAMIAGVLWLAKSTKTEAPTSGVAQEKYNAWKMARGRWYSPTNIILGSLAFGTAGIAVTSFQRVFKLLAGTTEEVLLGIFRGYAGWFNQEEELLQGTLLELRESLHRARNNQAGKEGSLYGVNEQVTYYRSDVISQYEYVMWRFQNLIALMYLIAPKRNHALLTNEVEQMVAYSETFAVQLEKDCNVNTHGFWTKYSAETLMMFHAMTECMKEFVTRFKTKLCR